MQEFSVFEYLYRDASNYKAWGILLLRGCTTESDLQVLENHFESGELFIAEQLGIPPLYAELWEFSSGPTDDDHVWHTFHSLRPARQEDMVAKVFGSVEGLISKIAAVELWNQALSPHWNV